MHRTLPRGLAAVPVFATALAVAQSSPTGTAPPTVTPPAAGSASTGPAGSGSAEAPPAPTGTEPRPAAPPRRAARRGPPPPPVVAPYEPPPPYVVPEPPPPPQRRHVAPRSALWVGGRGGWTLPFGNLWAREVDPSYYAGVPWSDYATSGPTLELDVGVRLARSYVVFALFEHATLGAGPAVEPAIGAPSSAESDFGAIGLRFSSDPSRVGFLTELAIGARRFRAKWPDGTSLEGTSSLEFRMALGADIRVSRLFSLSPMAMLSAGAFGEVDWVSPSGSSRSALGPRDLDAGHGTASLSLGGHFDLFGSP